MHSPAHMSAFAVYHWALLLLEVCVALCAGLALNAACARVLAGGPPDRYDNPRYVSRLGVCLAARSQWKPSCESRHTPQGRPARLVVFECHYVTRVAMKHRKILGALTGFIVDLFYWRCMYAFFALSWSLKLSLLFQVGVFPALCALSFASWRAAAGGNDSAAAAACLLADEALLPPSDAIGPACASSGAWWPTARDWLAAAWGDGAARSSVYDRLFLVVLVSYMAKDLFGVMTDRLLMLHHVVCAASAIVGLLQPAGVRFFLVGTTALELGSGAMNLASLSAKHSRKGKFEKTSVVLSFVVITLSHAVAGWACICLWRVALPAFFFVWWHACTWPLIFLRQKAVIEELAAVSRRYRPSAK